ncbi:hypothetical protein OC845_004727 [Tilletia horrida]|nr:hypothetical protein OC845_004727 [Tilletia horrida]
MGESIGPAARSAIVQFLAALETIREAVRGLAEAVSPLGSSGPLLIELQKCRYFTEKVLDENTHLIQTDVWVRSDPAAAELYADDKQQHMNTWKLEQLVKVLAICLADALDRFIELADVGILSIEPASRELETLLAFVHPRILKTYAKTPGHPSHHLLDRDADLNFLFADLNRNWRTLISELNGFSSAMRHPNTNDQHIITLSHAISKSTAALKITVADFKKIGAPVILKRQKRKSEGNTALGAAALLLANTVAQVGNSQLFTAQDNGAPVSNQVSHSLVAVQILWTISLTASIFTALLAAASISMFVLSVATFLGGLVASPHHLGFSWGVKAVTYASAALFWLFLAIPFASWRDAKIRRQGSSRSYDGRPDVHADLRGA